MMERNASPHFEMKPKFYHLIILPVALPEVKFCPGIGPVAKPLRVDDSDVTEVCMRFIPPYNVSSPDILPCSGWNEISFTFHLVFSNYLFCIFFFGS